MELCRSAPGNGEQHQPHQPLPRLLTTFVTEQLKSKQLLAAAAAASAAGGGVGAEAAGQAAALQAGCRALMQQALEQMKGLTAVAASTSAATAKAVAAASRGLYGLLEALQAIMAAPDYLRVRSTKIHITTYNHHAAPHAHMHARTQHLHIQHIRTTRTLSHICNTCTQSPGGPDAHSGKFMTRAALGQPAVIKQSLRILLIPFFASHTHARNTPHHT